jgi:hypothetical protein
MNGKYEMWPLLHQGAIWRNFIFSDRLFSLRVWVAFATISSPPGRENKRKSGEKNTRAFLFFLCRLAGKNRMHVRPYFRHFSSFGTISWPIAGKVVFFLRRNKQYVNLGQHCWFFSLLFWHEGRAFFVSWTNRY